MQTHFVATHCHGKQSSPVRPSPCVLDDFISGVVPPMIVSTFKISTTFEYYYIWDEALTYEPHTNHSRPYADKSKITIMTQISACLYLHKKSYHTDMFY